jgi:hypothetical protein
MQVVIINPVEISRNIERYEFFGPKRAIPTAPLKSA